MTAAAPLLTRRDRTMIAITVFAAIGAGALHFAHANSVVSFIVAALALATLASLVGRSVKALGDRILQSPVQIALTVAPIVCLSAAFLGQPGFDLVLSPLLLAVMVMSALVAVLVTFDGESNWFEGAALIALYIAIATAFWWG